MIPYTLKKLGSSETWFMQADKSGSSPEFLSDKVTIDWTLKNDALEQWCWVGFIVTIP